jgi:hypothetical protein
MAGVSRQGIGSASSDLLTAQFLMTSREESAKEGLLLQEVYQAWSGETAFRDRLSHLI